VLADKELEPIICFCRATWRYRMEEADYELMMRDYDQVLRLQPDFTFALYNKANLLCSKKEYLEAIQYYSRAISVDRDFAEAYFNRGLTYIYIGENEKGLADLSKAGELGIYQAYNLITRFK
jgi:tetratricopeptide (TPR) repeat protein